MPDTERSTLPSKKGVLLLFAVLMLCLVAVFGRTTNYVFVNWDDELYVMNNPDIREISAENAMRWLTRPYVALYVPLPMFSYALDYHFYGLAPQGFHRTNTGLHLAATGLLFFILVFLYKDPLLAFLAALLFGLHPVQVESVAWISQRKNLLCGVFLFAGFFSYIRGAAVTRDRKWMTAAVTFFVLALLSKATAVIVPLILLAFDYFFRGTTGKRKGFLLSLFLLIPALAMAGFTLALYPEIFTRIKFMQILDYPLMQIKTFFFYIKLTLWPQPLSLTYEYARDLYGTPGRFAVAAGFTVMAAGLVRATWKKRREAFWLWWFLLFLMPVCGLFRVPIADRHLYIPLAGLSGLAAAAGVRHRRLMLMALAVAVAVSSQMTLKRLPVWHDSYTLWRTVLQSRDPETGFLARMKLAALEEDYGNWENALALYRSVLDRNPRLPYAYLNYYNLCILHERKEEAEKARRLFRKNYSSHYDLDTLYRRLVAAKQDPARVRELLAAVMIDHGENTGDTVLSNLTRKSPFLSRERVS